MGRGSIAGTLSGMAEETAGYPLDLIKTRIQVHGDHPSGVLGIVRETLAKEGVGGLFKGLGPPFLASALVTATVFGAYGHAHDYFGRGQCGPLPIGYVGLAGGFAGFAQAFITCPVDVVKNRMQVQGLGHGHGGGVGNIAMAKQVLAARGARGFFLGFVPTLGRDVPGYAVFFTTYEYLKRKLGSINLLKKGDDPHHQQTAGHGHGDLNPIAVIFAGGVAGMAYHGSTYPFDVVKTMIQTQPDKAPVYRGTIDCFRKLYAAEGTSAFVRGFWPTVVRSFPANAVGFLVYELTMKLLPDE
jgi:solute carrier family 25 carnitine/acylcarnitine transporter 20/29